MWCFLVEMTIFNESGEELWYTDWNEWNDEVSYRKDDHNIELSAGTYYMQINGYRYDEHDKSTGKYTFSVTKLKQSNCSHDYIEKVVDATYFEKGYTLHKCNKCGKSYKDQYKDKRKLSQPYLYSSSITGKGSLKLSWSTVYDASGYQIRYATSKSMKSAVATKTVKGQSKSKKTIKNLSRKKKYYVQIRAYKTSGAKTVYSSWSSKMTLKTR